MRKGVLCLWFNNYCNDLKFSHTVPLPSHTLESWLSVAQVWQKKCSGYLLHDMITAGLCSIHTRFLGVTTHTNSTFCTTQPWQHDSNSFFAWNTAFWAHISDFLPEPFVQVASDFVTCEKSLYRIGHVMQDVLIEWNPVVHNWSCHYMICYHYMRPKNVQIYSSSQKVTRNWLTVPGHMHWAGPYLTTKYLQILAED
jgi:hypothetical protein